MVTWALVVWMLGGAQQRYPMPDFADCLRSAANSKMTGMYGRVSSSSAFLTRHRCRRNTRPGSIMTGSISYSAPNSASFTPT